jgi:hypothetical protein
MRPFDFQHSLTSHLDCDPHTPVCSGYANGIVTARVEMLCYCGPRDE